MRRRHRQPERSIRPRVSSSGRPEVRVRSSSRRHARSVRTLAGSRDGWSVRCLTTRRITARVHRPVLRGLPGGPVRGSEHRPTRLPHHRPARPVIVRVVQVAEQRGVQSRAPPTEAIRLIEMRRQVQHPVVAGGHAQRPSGPAHAFLEHGTVVTPLGEDPAAVLRERYGIARGCDPYQVRLELGSAGIETQRISLDVHERSTSRSAHTSNASWAAPTTSSGSGPRTTIRSPWCDPDVQHAHAAGTRGFHDGRPTS